MKAEALLDARTHKLEEIKPGKFGDTLAGQCARHCSHDKQLKTDTLVHTLGDV